jgi:isopenicillin N synthase-like dioxygenase
LIQDAEFRIPVIDFSKFRRAESAAALRHEAADEIVTAFKEVGFIYLKNHGIEDGTVKNAFKLVSCFFS